MAGKKKDRAARLAREAASRARRQANAAPPAPLPVTEASTALVAALTEAGLRDLAERARRLEFDENYGRGPLPLHDLVAALIRAEQPSLIERVKAGDFDATPGDEAAFAATPRGRAEHAETAADVAALPAELRAKMEASMAAMAADPAAQQRMMTEHVARMGDELNGPLVVPDEPDPDEPYDPAEVHAALRPLLGERGPAGERLDTAEILACAEMAGRTGGQGFELGWARDGVPTDKAGWYAQADYTALGKPHRVRVADLPGPAQACRAFLAQVLDGGRCTHCRRITSTNPAGVMGGDRMLLDGTRFTDAEQRAGGICVWRRDGIHWKRGCQ